MAHFVRSRPGKASTDHVIVDNALFVRGIIM